MIITARIRKKKLECTYTVLITNIYIFNYKFLDFNVSEERNIRKSLADTPNSLNVIFVYHYELTVKTW